MTHNDNDGDFCNAVLRYALSKYPNVDIQAIRTNYDITITPDLIDKIKHADEVWITDLNLSFSVMKSLKELAGKNATKWFYCDHHGRQFPESLVNNELSYIFDGFIYKPSSQTEGYCAAYILADFFNLTYDSHINMDMLEIVSGRDTWKLDNKELYDEMHYGLLAYNLRCDEREGVGYLISKILLRRHSLGWERTQEDGRAIMQYLKNYNSTICDEQGYEGIVRYKDKELKCFIINNFGSSDMFLDKINQYDICIRFNTVKSDTDYWPVVYAVSLYASKDSDINCSEICAVLGGGGHEKAAGFISQHNPFIIIDGVPTIIVEKGIS